VGLDAVHADRHPEAPPVHGSSLTCRHRQCLERRRGDERRPRACAPVVPFALVRSLHEPERPPRDGRERLVPGSLDEASRDEASVEARLHRLPRDDIALDDAALGEAKAQPPVVDFGPDGDQRRRALGGRERARLVDEIEATVAADAGRIELDRVDGDEPEPLDRCDGEPGDARNGYSTST